MPPEQFKPLVITRKQAAALLSVSVMTIIRWQDSGKLTAVKLPTGGVRCKLAEVEELAKKQKRLKLVLPPKATTG